FRLTAITFSTRCKFYVRERTDFEKVKIYCEATCLNSKGVNHECRNNIVNHRHPAFGGRHSQLASQSFLGIWSQRYSGVCVSGVVDTVINGAHLVYIHAKWIIVNQNGEINSMTNKFMNSLFLISLVYIFSG